MPVAPQVLAEAEPGTRLLEGLSGPLVVAQGVGERCLRALVVAEQQRGAAGGDGLRRGSGRDGGFPLEHRHGTPGSFGRAGTNVRLDQVTCPVEEDGAAEPVGERELGRDREMADRNVRLPVSQLQQPHRSLRTGLRDPHAGGGAEPARERGVLTAGDVGPETGLEQGQRRERLGFRGHPAGLVRDLDAGVGVRQPGSPVAVAPARRGEPGEQEGQQPDRARRPSDTHTGFQPVPRADRLLHRGVRVGRDHRELVDRQEVGRRKGGFAFLQQRPRRRRVAERARARACTRATGIRSAGDRPARRCAAACPAARARAAGRRRSG